METTWQHAADVSDSSLVIYYNFDEGPNHGTIKNHGIAGAQADLLNGRIFGGQLHFEANSQALRSVKLATFVPGPPVLYPSNVPIVVSLETTITMTIRLRCLAPSVVPTSSTITSFDDDGKLYQNNDGRNGDDISTFPTVVTSSTNDVRYMATNRSSVERFNYSLMCSGVSESGQVLISVMPQVLSDSHISIFIVNDVDVLVFLGGSNSIIGLSSAEITTLSTLGTLYQLNNPSKDVINITSVPTPVTNLLLGLRYFPHQGSTGKDRIGFREWHGGIGSEEVFAQITIKSWNFPPVIPPETALIIEDRYVYTHAYAFSKTYTWINICLNMICVYMYSYMYT
jgi:hypothetical protein